MLRWGQRSMGRGTLISQAMPCPPQLAIPHLAAGYVPKALEWLAEFLALHPACRGWQRRRMLCGMHPGRHPAAHARDRWAGKE